MSAQSSLAVYPEAVQSSVGLPGSLSSALLVQSMDFDFGGSLEEIADEDGIPDVLIYSGFRIQIGVRAKLKNRSGDFGGYAGGATKLALNTLPFNSALWAQGYSTMISSGAYAIFEMPKRTVNPTSIDDFNFNLRLHGFKPATRFPV